jgi:hypothetical protein
MEWRTQMIVRVWVCCCFVLFLAALGFVLWALCLGGVHATIYVAFTLQPL